MKLVPKSLTARLFLVLLFGLVMVQIIGGMMIFKERGEAIHNAREDHLIRRVVMTIQTFDAVSPSEYEKLVTSFNRPAFNLEISEQPLYQPSQKYRFFMRHLHRALSRRIGEFRPIHLAPGIDWDNDFDDDNNDEEHHRHKGFWRGFPINLSTTLPNGQWINISTSVDPSKERWGKGLFGSLLFVIAVIAMLAFVAVRWLTKPLTTLSKAVDQFGRDKEPNPLPEKGPKEVVEAAAAFNRMQHQISRHIKEREEMLAAVSHDLRTPLTRMRLRLELQDDEKLQQTMTQDIEEMELMITSTLDYMRGIANDEKVSTIALSKLLQDLVKEQQQQGHDVTLQSAEVDQIEGRPIAIRRCINNIIENGIKYGGEVTVTARETDNHIEISIADNGSGIPEEQHESVFSPFTRLDKSRSRETGGSGLGLGIARTIARSAGGDVVIANGSEGGLEVIITFSKKLK